MDKLLHFGRICFSISIAFFGAQYLLYGRFEGGLPLVPPWTPGAPALAYVLGAALILSAVSIATLWNARYSALSIGTLLLLSFLFLHSLHASSILHNGTDRTRAFEGLTLSAIAFTLAGTLSNGRNSQAQNTTTNWPITLGRFLFTFSMIVFGAQHFMYAAFIATLIPAWIPVHLFWVYFSGTGFIVAGLSIATGILAPLASMGLGLMFLLWFLLLHAPRVAASPRNGNEWTSAFVALAVSGGSFILAAALATTTQPLAKEKSGPERPAFPRNQETYVAK
ncbi:MAG: DoxX [Candidatus Acidoferrum typicum]|nr:DoxX [Candidatus Acidoferrum typicum]